MPAGLTDYFEMFELGLARGIGVANFDLAQLSHLVSAGPRPLINQVEFQPQFHDEAMHTFCATHQIQMVAYGSLVTIVQRTDASPSDSIRQIAARHNISVARLALDWTVARGVAVIPRSRSSLHLADNLKVGSEQVGLSPEELVALATMQPAGPARRYEVLAIDMQDGHQSMATKTEGP